MAGAFDVALDDVGKHVGALRVPHSSETSAWGTVLVPVVSIRGSEPGPCVLLTGGSHGDELEGPMVLGELARRLEPTAVRGHVIIVPELNAPAVRACSRISPLDDKNMNRVFPGKPRGSVSERIAHLVTTELVARADVVVDLHAGGRSLEFAPTGVVHALDDAARMERTLGLVKAFGAPYALVLSEQDPEGMLDTTVERAGKLFMSTELGGGARVTPTTIAIASRGVRNVLGDLGVLAEPAEPSHTRLLTVGDDGFVSAADDGLFEPACALGDEVSAGDVVGWIHRRAAPMRQRIEQHAAVAGIVMGRRALAATQAGDCLTVIAQPYGG